jgi:hypothetical protein
MPSASARTTTSDAILPPRLSDTLDVPECSVIATDAPMREAPSAVAASGDEVNGTRPLDWRVANPARSTLRHVPDSRATQPPPLRPNGTPSGSALAPRLRPPPDTA